LSIMGLTRNEGRTDVSEGPDILVLRHTQESE
jgi:hypothetical protein